jgi:hypothetical protein
MKQFWRSTLLTKIYRVLSANRYDFQKFIEIFEIKYNDARKIANRDYLRGLPRGTEIFCINEYQRHKDFKEIYEEMIRREMRPIEIRF